MTQCNCDKNLVHPESPERRKIVKSLVGGVTALAAFQSLPTNWSKPIIEQVFLPAHAATSGTTVECNTSPLPFDDLNYNWNLSISIMPQVAGENLYISRTVTESGGNTQVVNLTLVTDATGSFSLNDSFEMATFVRVDYVITLDGSASTATCSFVAV